MIKLHDLVMFRIKNLNKCKRPVNGVWEVIEYYSVDIYYLREVNPRIEEQNRIRMRANADELFVITPYRNSDDLKDEPLKKDIIKEYWDRALKDGYKGGYLQTDTNVVIHKDNNSLLHSGMSEAVIDYLDTDMKSIYKTYIDNYGFHTLPVPKKILFNSPATIVFWEDGDKTVVKCMKEDIYDKEKGFVLCLLKKMLSKKGYREAFKQFKNFDVVPDLGVKEDISYKWGGYPEPKFVKGDKVFRVSPANYNNTYIIKKSLYSHSSKCWSYLIDDMNGFTIWDNEYNIVKIKEGQKWNEDIPKENLNHRFGCIFDIGDIVKLKHGKVNFKIINVRIEKYGRNLVNRYRIQALNSPSKYTTYEVEKRLVLVKRGSQK